jgi:Beta galactosidase small chain
LESIVIGQKKLPLSNGPKFVAFKRNDRKYDDVAGPGRLNKISSQSAANETLVEATYEGALRRVTWKIHRNRNVLISYEYAYDGVVDMIGVQFESRPEEMRRIRWLGMGPYRVWQNRSHGTTLDVWENKYNDSVPGESWVFPEFKGYFRDWRWARLDTLNGSVTLESGDPNTFLGLFKPRDGVNGLLDLPETGIAFLDVIPAMRNKFHTTDEIGPQSKSKKVSGVVKRTVMMRFE